MELGIVAQVVGAAYVPVYRLLVFPVLSNVVFTPFKILYVQLNFFTVKNKLQVFKSPVLERDLLVTENLFEACTEFRLFKLG